MMKSEHSGQKSSPARLLLLASFFASLLIGILSTAVIVFAKDNIVLVLASMLLLPFLITFLLTHRFLDALLLTWIQEMFFGGTGNWITVGAISGRWLLFMFLLFAYGFTFLLKARKSGENRTAGENRLHAAILFFGVIFPLWLVLYSVVFKGTPLLRALQDIHFFTVLLVYFPLRSLVMRRHEVLLGYLIGACFGLSLLLLFLSTGPVHLRETSWRVLSGNFAVPIGTTASGISRLGLLNLAFLNIVVFFGLWLVIKKGEKISVRLAGCLMAGVGLAPIIITFQRGPILSVIFVLILVSLSMIMVPFYRRLAVRLLVVLSIFAVAAIWTMIRFVPEGLESKFSLKDGLSSWVGDVRQQQIQVTWKILMEEPLLGKGVGVHISDLNRRYEDPTVLQMEAQYNMLLYRFGIIAFGIFLAPLFWLFLQLPRTFRKHQEVLQSQAGSAMLSLLLSSLAILLNGTANPYLTTPYTGFLIAGYLAYKKAATG